MSEALDFLFEDKKQELKASWINNIFYRYKIVNSANSLTEAILRSFNRGEYKRTYPELEKFYIQIRDELIKPSKYSAKEIYMKIFQSDNLKEYMRMENIILVKTEINKIEDITNIGFYYEEYPDYKFYFFPKEIRKLIPNCNLIKILASIDINLPYNYFKIRFREKLDYILLNNIVNNIKSKKKVNEALDILKDKKNLNHYLSFSKNLLSDSIKEDFKFYLFLFPKIFDVNFIIFTPFDNEIVVINIIEENEEYPYLLLFQPLENISNFKIELGSILINRKAYFLLENNKNKEIIEKIKDRYYDNNNNKPLLDYLKYNKNKKYSKYLKDYDSNNTNNNNIDIIEDLINKIKYYDV